MGTKRDIAAIKKVLALASSSRCRPLGPICRNSDARFAQGVRPSAPQAIPLETVNRQRA